MSQFSSDLRLVIFIFGIFWGIRTLIKEYQKNKIKLNPKCFIFFVLAVFFFEVVIIWEIFTICNVFLEQMEDISNYIIFSWALSCFSFSGYIFTDAALNGNVSQSDKFKGKVAFGIGIYLTLGAIVFFQAW